jgi:hypothetical protein
MNKEEKVALYECPKCEETKEQTKEFFYKDKTKRNGFDNQCKSCRKEYMKDYRALPEYKDYQKEYGKEYKKEGFKKKIKGSQRNVIKKKTSAPLKNSKDLHKDSPLYKIKANMSSAFSVLLKRMNTVKPHGTMHYTDCTKKELLDHFNSGIYTATDYIRNTKDVILFHIDHIIPSDYYLKKLKLDADNNITPETEPWLYKWWNPRNLRVWPAKDNLTKSATVDHDLIAQYGIEDLLTL